MAKRPWVTPRDVRDFTASDAVKNRTDTQLMVDITRAEQYTIAYTCNDFAAFKPLPQEVKTAVILLAEHYGGLSAKGEAQLMKSESFDDYSYTSKAGEEFSAFFAGVATLLKEFRICSGNVSMSVWSF